MLSHIRLLFALLFFFADGENASDDDATDDDSATNRDDSTADDLGDKGKAAIAAERKARRAAEAAAKAAQERLDTLEADAKKRAESEAVEQGKWQELAEKREADLATTTESLSTLKATNETLLTLVKADVDAAWNDLPDEVRDAYDGDDDDPLAKKQHMTRMAKVIERLTVSGATPGNGPNPKPSDGTIDHETALRRARASGKYTA